MLGTYVSPIRTPVSPSALKEGLRLQLVRLLTHAPSEHALDVLVAASAFETGRWKSCWNFNLGNVKAESTWTGEYTCLANVREVIQGVERWFSPEGETAGKGGPVIGQRYSLPPGHPATRFRAYPDIESGCEGWVEKLAKRYRESLELLLAGCSSDDFIASLKRQGYFTGELDAYQAGVRSIQAEFEGRQPSQPPLVK